MQVLPPPGPLPFANFFPGLPGGINWRTAAAPRAVALPPPPPPRTHESIKKALAAFRLALDVLELSGVPHSSTAVTCPYFAAVHHLFDKAELARLPQLDGGERFDLEGQPSKEVCTWTSLETVLLEVFGHDLANDERLVYAGPLGALVFYRLFLKSFFTRLSLAQVKEATGWINRLTAATLARASKHAPTGEAPEVPVEIVLRILDLATGVSVPAADSSRDKLEEWHKQRHALLCRTTLISRVWHQASQRLLHAHLSFNITKVGAKNFRLRPGRCVEPPLVEVEDPPAPTTKWLASTAPLTTTLALTLTNGPSKAPRVALLLKQLLGPLASCLWTSWISSFLRGCWGNPNLLVSTSVSSSLDYSDLSAPSSPALLTELQHLRVRNCVTTDVKQGSSAVSFSLRSLTVETIELHPVLLGAIVAASCKSMTHVDLRTVNLHHPRIFDAMLRVLGPVLRSLKYSTEANHTTFIRHLVKLEELETTVNGAANEIGLVDLLPPSLRRLTLHWRSSMQNPAHELVRVLGQQLGDGALPGLQTLRADVSTDPRSQVPELATLVQELEDAGEKAGVDVEWVQKSV